MRFTTFLILLALVFLAAHFIIGTHRLNRMYGQSTALMATDVPAAIEAFRPALAIKDYNTFGRASKIRRQWIEALVENSIGRLNKPTFTQADARNLVAALEELKSTEILTLQQREETQKRVIEHLGPTPATLAENGFLPDFDRFVDTLRRLSQEPILFAALQTQANDVLVAAQRIDRYPIALRTVEFESLQALRNGLNYLGITPPAGPSIIQLPLETDTSSWEEGPAEASFHRAHDLVETFIEQWHPATLPPSLERIVPVAYFNSGMLRFANAVFTGQGGEEWRVYLLPDTKPGEAPMAIHRANYKVGLAAYLNRALETAGMLPPDDPARRALDPAARAALQEIEQLTNLGEVRTITVRMVLLF